MKLKKGLQVSSDDPWYDLSDGGYLNPREMCESPEDAQRVIDAIAVVEDFIESCRIQIEDFIR